LPEGAFLLVQKSIAGFLVATVLGTVSPVFAGDEPDPKFLLPKPASFGLLHNYLPYAPQQSGQQQPPSQPPQSQKKQLTTAGKVLKWVGVGLMAEGGLDFAVGAADANTTVCTSITNNNFCISGSTVRDVWFGLGGVTAGVGAILFFVGIHKTE
jgi:hypothetical protein